MNQRGFAFAYAGSTTNVLTLAGGPATFNFGGFTATVLGGGVVEWDPDLQATNFTRRFYCAILQ